MEFYLAVELKKLYGLYLYHQKMMVVDNPRTAFLPPCLFQMLFYVNGFCWKAVNPSTIQLLRYLAQLGSQPLKKRTTPYLELLGSVKCNLKTSFPDWGLVSEGSISYQK